MAFEINWKDFIKRIIFFVIISITIVILFNKFQISFLGKYLILLGINLTFLLILRQYSHKTLMTNAIFILIFMLLYKALGLIAGIIGWFIADIILALAIIILRWKSFIQLKRDTETAIWGKPLKHYQDKGIKPPKIKITK